MGSAGDQKVKSHTVSYSHLYFIQNNSISVFSMSRFFVLYSLFFVENVRCSQQRIKKEIEVFVTNSELPYQLKSGLHKFQFTLKLHRPQSPELREFIVEKPTMENYYFGMKMKNHDYGTIQYIVIGS